MTKGVVKFYNESKGFGFITESGTEKEVFVHASGIKGQIKQGDTVTFEIEAGKRGLTAVNVQLA